MVTAETQAFSTVVHKAFFIRGKNELSCVFPGHPRSRSVHNDWSQNHKDSVPLLINKINSMGVQSHLYFVWVSRVDASIRINALGI